MGIGLLKRYHRQRMQAAQERGDDAIASVFAGKLLEHRGFGLPYNLEARVRGSLVAAQLDDIELVIATPDAELVQLQYVTDRNVAALRTALQAALNVRTNTESEFYYVLPQAFPSAPALHAAGYATLESLADHSFKQLMLIPGMDEEQAKAVLESYTSWKASYLEDNLENDDPDDQTNSDDSSNADSAGDNEDNATENTINPSDTNNPDDQTNSSNA
jgi:hypothetical protein